MTIAYALSADCACAEYFLIPPYSYVTMFNGFIAGLSFTIFGLSYHCVYHLSILFYFIGKQLSTSGINVVLTQCLATSNFIGYYHKPVTNLIYHL